MNILITGATSQLGSKILNQLLKQPEIKNIWCGINRNKLLIKHPKVHTINLNLEKEPDLSGIQNSIDLVIHFAGVSHSFNEKRYWDINYSGSLQLVKKIRKLGCKRFVYISTRCAIPGTGAYGESKLALEKALLTMEWQSLLIIRPSEIYGLDRKGGVDRCIRMASKVHLVPLFFGISKVRFAPLFYQDFIDHTLSYILSHREGIRSVNLMGPEIFNGWSFSLRIACKYKALPVPIWVPLLVILFKFFSLFSYFPFAPDQVSRMFYPKDRLNQGTFLPDKPLVRFLKSQSISEHE